MFPGRKFVSHQYSTLSDRNNVRGVS